MSGSANTPLIEVADLGVRLNTSRGAAQAVRKVSFSLRRGAMLGLVGESGCGKTTVLRCIAGLIRVKDGYFDIDGEIWQDRDRTFIPTYQRPLGYVFQEASLFPHLSVRHNLLFGAPPEKPSDRPAIDFDEVVDLLGIRPLLDRSPSGLRLTPLFRALRRTSSRLR